MDHKRNEAFSRHVYAVQRYTTLTWARFKNLARSNLTTHPICCFGNLNKAKIVTMGVNPSATEFQADRKWPKELSHEQLAERCVTYFNGAPPHPWFSKWSEGLGQLGLSYEAGDAVHLDISPRATQSMSQLSLAGHDKLFLEMLEQDLWTFFGTLMLCSQVKLIMMAGAVTGQYYINEYLALKAANHGAALTGKFERLAQPGRGKVQFHHLEFGSQNIPVFFCSSSPSDRGNTVLVDRVKDNSGEIQRLLER